MKKTILSTFLLLSFWAYSQDLLPQLNQKLDSIMTASIRAEVFPGAQILVAKSGKVIFHKSYGYQTYDSITKVSNNNLYDLASVTKIASTLPAIMSLVDENKIDLDAPFSKYWKPWRKNKSKRELTVREILAHQAGLKPYIVFLDKITNPDQSFKKKFVRTSYSKRFPIKAYNNIYINRRFHKKIYREIDQSKVFNDKKYLYSGLAFLLFPKIIENLSGESFESYITTHFYKPLGASKLVFNPHSKGFDRNLIIPTERDSIYRKEVVRAWVHDENASLFGGVSGNAGLFGTADDLSKLMQMYLNMGYYGGHRFISNTTMQEFTKIQYPENNNRRGIGFDKPLIDNHQLGIDKAYPAPQASPSSFGHSGFTGTFVWADPEHKLVFIFLSNRVYPNRSHRKIYELHTRIYLMSFFYKALI